MSRLALASLSPLALAPLLALLSLAPPAGAAPYELVLAGGRVMDPESGLDAVRNVGVAEGRIAALSETALEGAQVVDVSGLVVAPGFVDLHEHGQNATSHALHARDGVTSALDLEAGAWPVAPFYAEREGETLVSYGVSVGHIAARVELMHGFAIGHRPTSAGHESGIGGSLQRIVERFYRPMGYARDAATPEQVTELLGLLGGGLDDGALGIGMGLDYTPGASEDEIRAVFDLAAERGVPVLVHMRGAVGADDMSQIDALLGHAEATRAALHIFHLGSSGGPRALAYLERIRAARAHGLDVTTEVYPYLASSTYLESALFDEGWQERLGISYGDLRWAATGERLTAESFARYRAEGGMVIAYSMKAENVDALVAAPDVMIASDGMPFFEQKVHPRGAGTFARVLGRYVRERRLLPLMSALRKMTLLPAQRLEGFAPAFRAKGRVRVGADADLTVFDPARVIDRATFEDPFQPSAGIVHTLVGGTFVVRGEENVTGVAPGRGLRSASRP
jgi:dihydroorotase